MVRAIFLTFCFVLGLNGSYLEVKHWNKGESFLTFLEDNNISQSIYYDLDKEDRELAMEIQSGTSFDILKSDDGQIEQVLIPVGEELQLHLIKDKKTSLFSMQTTPVSYENENLSVVIDIERSPYQDIIAATNNVSLANEFVNSYKKSVDFRRLRKGDKLAIFYSQKKRLGKIYGNTTIQAAMIEVRGKENYVFLYDENRYFSDTGKELEGYVFKLPLSSYKRISSKFTHKRWHPILKKYRAHLGIDYAARIGTRVKAAGNGKVIFVGRKGGYGKTIEIRHSNGYKTLYAHLNGYKKGIKRGKRVSKGQVIGFVGNTGLSTGPHLHFGLYKNNRAINPSKVVKVTKNVLTGKKRKKFLAYVDDYKKKFKLAIDNKATPVKEERFNYIVSLDKSYKQPSAN